MFLNYDAKDKAIKVETDEFSTENFKCFKVEN